MDSEELLVPRFIVIGKYPNSPYSIGDIIVLSGRSFHLTSTNQRNEFGETVRMWNYVPNETIMDYPLLFKKLNWYECRSETDLPKYVKRLKPDKEEIFHVFKVSSWRRKSVETKEIIGFNVFENMPVSFNGWNPEWLPSSEEEYELFKSISSIDILI